VNRSSFNAAILNQHTTEKLETEKIVSVEHSSPDHFFVVNVSVVRSEAPSRWIPSEIRVHLRDSREGILNDSAYSVRDLGAVAASANSASARIEFTIQGSKSRGRSAEPTIKRESINWRQFEPAERSVSHTIALAQLPCESLQFGIAGRSNFKPRCSAQSCRSWRLRAAAIISANRSGVQANTGTPIAESFAA
jgi:hypothetical protein